MEITGVPIRVPVQKLDAQLRTRSALRKTDSPSCDCCDVLYIFEGDVALVQPHVQHIMKFIEIIARDDESGDAVVGASCGLIG